MRAREHSGVALSELLIVIAVVALLATVLLPVFARAREGARQAVCLGNVQTIARAILMYLADNDRAFPPQESDPNVLSYFNTYPGGGAQDTWNPERTKNCPVAWQANPYLRWPVILDPYLPTRDVWRCPDARLQGGPSFINGASDWLAHLKAHEGLWGRTRLCPKALTFPTGWGGEVTDSITQQRMPAPFTSKGRVASPGMFLQSIGTNRTAAWPWMAQFAAADPSSFVICADAGATVDDFCTGTLAYPDLCHLECAGPGSWEADWENCPWTRQCGAIGAMKTNPELRKPYARHFGGVNIGFLDGHARWMNSEEVIAESPSWGNFYRGRLRGYEPWGPTSDMPGAGVHGSEFPGGVPPLY